MDNAHAWRVERTFVLTANVTSCHALIAQQFSTIDNLQHKLEQLEHYVAQLVRARFLKPAPRRLSLASLL
jgi:hypothetical protein